MSNLNIGLIGIGSMGWPMGARIRQAGFPLVAMDAVPARAEQFGRETGTKAAKTGAELARDSDVVITMLPTSNEVAQALTGDDGVLKTLRKDCIIVEMSSGVPSRTQELAALVKERGSVLIDAPVSGGVPRAKTGDLAIMVGGDAAAIERVRPLLKSMGSSITRVGEVGSAHAMKALNNLVSAGGFLIGIEALLIGSKFGIDEGVMVDILNASSGMNNSTQKKFKQFVLSRAFNAGFGLDLMVKDLGIALELGRDAATPTPFAALCREMWAAAAVLLGKGQDHTAVAKLSEKLAGLELGQRSQQRTGA
jgi:3-hydroxyisobutyrate dehydrogenase